MTDAYTQEKDSLEASANQVAYVQGVQLGSFAYTMKGSWVTNQDGSVSAPAFLTAFTPSATLSAAIADWLARQPTTPPTVVAAFSVTVDGNTIFTDDQTSGATDELWDYGDGSTEDTMGDQTHTYSQSGDFTIRLTASNAGGTSTATQTVTITLPDTTPVQPPANGVAGQPVTLTGTLADGTAINLTANPGDKTPLDATRPQIGRFHYYPDGLCVRIENAREDVPSDLSGTFTITAGGQTIWDGPLTIWARSNTRFFWLQTPTLLASPDLSGFPRLEGGATASMYAAYQQADNSPMGIGLACPLFQNQGERADLGSQWDACYLTNPTAENLTVVLGMADVASVFPFHCIDKDTGDLIDLRNNPKTSFDIVGQYGNRIAFYPKTACPMNMNEAQAHATYFCALAAALTGADAYKEELAAWANYVGALWQSWSYRRPSGVCSLNFGQVRGKGRGLQVLLQAEKYSDRPDYFTPWIEDLAVNAQNHYLSQTGIAIDQAHNVYPNDDWAVYQQHLLVDAIGAALDAAHTSFQTVFDYFATTLMDAVLESPHEFAFDYTRAQKDTSGNEVANWVAAMAVDAGRSPRIAAALKCTEGSQALQDAMGWSGGQPGDYNVHQYPTSPTGYPALGQGAYAQIYDHATDQTRAKAAWAKIAARIPRINYANNPKYNVWPKTLA